MEKTNFYGLKGNRFMTRKEWEAGESYRQQFEALKAKIYSKNADMTSDEVRQYVAQISQESQKS